MKLTREYIEDIKNLQSIDVVAKLELALMDEMRSGVDFEKWKKYWFGEPKGKQIFNENDPYGEELWEDE